MKTTKFVMLLTSLTLLTLSTAVQADLPESDMQKIKHCIAVGMNIIDFNDCHQKLMDSGIAFDKKSVEQDKRIQTETMGRIIVVSGNSCPYAHKTELLIGLRLENVRWAFQTFCGVNKHVISANMIYNTYVLKDLSVIIEKSAGWKVRK